MSRTNISGGNTRRDCRRINFRAQIQRYTHLSICEEVISKIDADPLLNYRTFIKGFVVFLLHQFDVQESKALENSLENVQLR